MMIRTALAALACLGLGWLLYRTVAFSRHSGRVTARWLFEQDRATERNTFEGISIQWPIQKQANEAGKFNSARLRKRA